MKFKTLMLTVALCVLCGASDAAPAPRVSTVRPKHTPLTDASTQWTRLRVDTPSLVVDTRRGLSQVQYVSVRVRNVGSLVAQHISVSAVFPGGLGYPLRGPKRLQPGQSGTFVSSTRIPLLRHSGPRIMLDCTPCRR